MPRVSNTPDGRRWEKLRGVITLLAGIVWVNGCRGALLTRSSSDSLDPHNPAFRMLTPGVLIALGMIGLVVIGAGGQ